MTGRADEVAGRFTGVTLAVTSSTGVMGLAVGVVDEEAVSHLASVEIGTERRHAEEISPRLAGLLTDAGLSLADVDRLVIDIGPGRFTGLRVGLASVRALGFALGRPVIGVTSLNVLAAGATSDAEPHGGFITAVIDARRAEVFQQTFERGVPVAKARVGDPEAMAPEARGVVVGDGADRYAEHYRRPPGTGATLIPARNPDASVMLELSRGLAGKPGTEVEPLYLRDPDVNPNIKTRPGGR